MKSLSLPRFFITLAFLVLPFSYVRLIKNFVITDLFATLALGSCLLVFFFTQYDLKDYFFKKNIFVLPFMLYSAGVGISFLRAIDPIESLTSYLQIFFIFIILYPTLLIVVSRESIIPKAITAYSVTISLLSIGMIIFYIIWVKIDANFFIYVKSWGGRYSYGTYEPNVAGRLFLQGILMLITLVITRRRNVSKILLVIPMLLTIYSMYITASRSALLGLALGIVLNLVFHKRMKKEFNLGKSIWISIFGITILLIILGSLGIFGEKALERYSTIFSGSSGGYSNVERISMIEQSIDQIKTNPFVGVGLENLSKHIFEKTTVHNPIIASWAENGILGFLGFSAFYLIIFAAMVISYIRRFYDNRYIAGLAIVSMAMIFGDMFMANSYKRSLWIPSLLFVAIIYNKEINRGEREDILSKNS